MEQLLAWVVFGTVLILILAGEKGRNAIVKALFVGAYTVVKWLVVRLSKALWRLIKRLFLGRGKGLKPTRVERRLMERLEPQYWRKHAEGRGLEGTLTGRPKLTKSGIVVSVRLDGKWTVPDLKSNAERVRSLLGAPSDLRMDITRGSQGGWAKVQLRTRSAADGDDMKWSENQTSFGVDTVTGEYVLIPLGIRLLIAGASNAGKSVAARPIMWQASEGETNALIIIDLKQIEGRLWDHRARVAFTVDQVKALVKELIAEMEYRQSTLTKGMSSWVPTKDHPRITVVVDEGAEVNLKVKQAIDDLESVARMGRASCIDLVWMTQSPTYTDGIPRQIAKQITQRICLWVESPAEGRVVLGEKSTDLGWHPDQLEIPGFALVKRGPNSKPHPVRVRHMTDKDVIALPNRRVWSLSDAPDEPGSSDTPETLPEPLHDPVQAVVTALRESDEPVPTARLIKCCGVGRSQGYAVLKRMQLDGRIKKHGHGRYVLGEGAA